MLDFERYLVHDWKRYLDEERVEQAHQEIKQLLRVGRSSSSTNLYGGDVKKQMAREPGDPLFRDPIRKCPKKKD